MLCGQRVEHHENSGGIVLAHGAVVGFWSTPASRKLSLNCLFAGRNNN